MKSKKPLGLFGYSVTNQFLLLSICLGSFAVTGWIETNSLSAQIPTSKLLQVFPVGGKVGSTVDVTVAGADLDEAIEMVFSNPKITAKVKMTVGTEFIPAVPVANQFTVTIPPDVQPGIYEVRVVGRFGLSTPRRFSVGQADELVCSDQNKSFETAMPISVNSVVNGKAIANSSHYFKFALKKDEKITIDCRTRMIDSRMDPVVTIIDLNGRELGRARSTVIRPATLFFTAPIESQYVVVVRDAVYAGSADFFYRLTVSNRPYLTAVFPNVIQAESNPSLTLYGWNLPGGELVGDSVERVIKPASEVVRISQNSDDLPLQTSGYSLDWKSIGLLENGKLISNQLPIYTSPLAVALEDDAKESTEVKIPTEISGRFLPGTEDDYYEFDAKKGEVYYLDAFSHRLGNNSDLIMTVQQKQVAGDGKVTWKQIAVADDPGNRGGGPTPDFSITTDDPTIRLQVPADGRFRVVLKDQFGTYQKDFTSNYRICIRKPTPDFRVICSPMFSRPANGNQILAKSLSLRNGGRIQVQSKIERMDGFDGPVTLYCENLPAGVICEPVELNPSQSSGHLVFHAKDDAATGRSFIKVFGKSVVDGNEVIREAVTTVVVWDTGNKTQSPAFYRRTASFELSVLPAGVAPVAVSAGDGKVLETSLGGKISVPVKLIRKNFGEALKLTADSLPAQMKPGDLTIAKDKNEAAIEVFVKDKNIKTGLYSFTLRGDAKFKFSRNPEAATRAAADLQRLEELVKKNVADKAAATTAMTTNSQKLPEFDKQIAAAKKKIVEATQLVAVAQKKVTDLQAVIVKSKAQSNPGVDPLLISAAEAQLVVLQKSVESQKASVLKSAQDSLVTLEKSKTEMAAAGESAKQKIAALDARQKQVEAARNAAKTKLDNLKKQSNPKDLFYIAVSNPIALRIMPSPIAISKLAEQTATTESTVTPMLKIVRKYGFGEAVTLSFKAPAGVPGIVLKPVTLAKDKSESPVSVEIQKNCPPGSHLIEVVATAKFNNVDVRSVETFVLKVTPKSAP